MSNKKYDIDGIIVCGDYQNCFICSKEALLPIMTALLNSKSIEIIAVRMCSLGGYHIFIDHKGVGHG